MSWSPRTKIRLLVGIFVGLLLVLAGGIWFVMRSEELAPTRREAADWIELIFISGKKARQQLDAELDKIRAAGEPLTIKEIVPPEVPDSENAAVLYQQAFDKLSLSEADEELLRDLLDSISPDVRGPYRVYKPEPGEHPGARPGPLPRARPDPLLADSRQWHWKERCTIPPPLAELEPIVAKNAAAIKLLEAAARRPKCRFPVNWEGGFDAEFPHYAKLRKCSRLLATTIYVRARRGEVDSALHTAQVSLAMSEAIRSEPTLIGQLVRYAMVAITLPPLQAALSEQSPPTSACQELFDYLAQMEFRQSFVHALWGERVMSISIFDHEPELRKLYGSPMGRKWSNLDEGMYLRLTSQAIAHLSKPWRQNAHAGEWFERAINTIPHYCIMTRLFVPAFTRSVVKRDQVIAQVGLAQAALALKAYKNKEGSYPDSLEELRQVIAWELREDPFSGEDLVYKREGDGFLIYSIGPNLKDDGGIVSEGWEEGDIIWRCKK